MASPACDSVSHSLNPASIKTTGSCHDIQPKRVHVGSVSNAPIQEGSCHRTQCVQRWHGAWCTSDLTRSKRAVPGVADSILGRLHDAFTASMVGTVGTHSAGTLAARPDLAHCMA